MRNLPWSHQLRKPVGFCTDQCTTYLWLGFLVVPNLRVEPFFKSKNNNKCVTSDIIIKYVIIDVFIFLFVSIPVRRLVCSA